MNLIFSQLSSFFNSFYSKTTHFSDEPIKKVIFVIYSLLKPLFILIISLWGIIFLTYISLHSFYIISNLNYIDMNIETLYSLIPDLCLILLAIITGVRYYKLYLNTKKQSNRSHEQNRY